VLFIWKCCSRAYAVQVAGESGLGKTTFINTLFSTTIKNYADHKRRHHKQIDKTVEIEITKAELEEKFFKGGFSCVLYLADL
jgi:cell division control protein 12